MPETTDPALPSACNTYAKATLWWSGDWIGPTSPTPGGRVHFAVQKRPLTDRSSRDFRYLLHQRCHASAIHSAALWAWAIKGHAVVFPRLDSPIFMDLGFYAWRGLPQRGDEMAALLTLQFQSCIYGLADIWCVIAHATQP